MHFLGKLRDRISKCKIGFDQRLEGLKINCYRRNALGFRRVDFDYKEPIRPEVEQCQPEYLQIRF